MRHADPALSSTHVLIGNFWSCKNIGDLAILYATLKTLDKTVRRKSTSVLTYDADSFRERREIEPLLEDASVYPTLSRKFLELLGIDVLEGRGIVRIAKLVIQATVILLLPLATALAPGHFFRRRLPSVQLVVFPGGDYLSARSIFTVFSAIEYLSTIAYFSHFLRKKVIIGPQSIGPLRGALLRGYARIV
ncbi:MAG: polysaccharide pyruvyl transferase family protein, partial [Candidatus Geothermarchaeales archaeon]